MDDPQRVKVTVTISDEAARTLKVYAKYKRVKVSKIIEDFVVANLTEEADRGLREVFGEDAPAYLSQRPTTDRVDAA